MPQSNFTDLVTEYSTSEYYQLLAAYGAEDWKIGSGGNNLTHKDDFNNLSVRKAPFYMVGAGTIAYNRLSYIGYIYLEYSNLATNNASLPWLGGWVGSIVLNPGYQGLSVRCLAH